MSGIDDALGAVTFDANGLVPAIAQQHDTGEVLMMAWMNRAALAETLETGQVCYWSRSRQKLWRNPAPDRVPRRLRRRHGPVEGRSDRRGLPHGAPQLLLSPRGQGRAAGDRHAGGRPEKPVWRFILRASRVSNLRRNTDRRVLLHSMIIRTLMINIHINQ